MNTFMLLKNVIKKRKTKETIYILFGCLLEHASKLT